MKRSGKSLICLLCVLGLSRMAGAVSNDAGVAPAHAADTENPYSAIWLRNVFDLKPAPPPAATPEPTNAPPPGVRLIGLADYAHVKMAMFQVTRQPEPGKPSANLETSCMLREGERRDIGSAGNDLEVVEIDLAGKKAMIKLQGAFSSINLETNKSAGGAGGGHMAGGRGNPPGGVNPVGASYGNNGAPPPNLSRPSRTSNNPNAQYPPQGTQNNVAQPVYFNAAYNGNTSAPGMSLPGSSAPGSSGSSAAATASDPSQTLPPPEVSAAILAAQHLISQNPGQTLPASPPPLDLSAPPSDAPPTSAPTGTPTLPLGATVHGTPPPGLP